MLDRLSVTLSALKLDKKYYKTAMKIIDDLGLSVMMAKENVNEAKDFPTVSDKFKNALDNLPEKYFHRKGVLALIKKLKEKDPKAAMEYTMAAFGWMKNMKENRSLQMDKTSILNKIVKEEIVRIKEAKMKKVDKNWWRKASDDKRFDALLSVVKDPDEAEEYVDAKWNDLPSGFERDMTIYESMLGEGKSFKPGDMWSDDFDYKGMLVYGMKYKPTGDLKKDILAMKALHSSFEDVNYHSESSPLWDAMKLYTSAFSAKSNPAKQGQLTAKADALLTQFNKACANALKSVKEGFANYAQQQAAYASGYKGKGKKRKKEAVEESNLNEGFATWKMQFAAMTISGVKLDPKKVYTVKARSTVEAIKKASKQAGLSGDSWMATQTHKLEKVG